jgi:cytochrome c-type biogenesis protein CcmH/NrfG
VNSYAYYITWLQELTELRAAGLISDEEYALSRAERVEHLFEQPGRPWMKWLIAGIPTALAASAVAVYFTGDVTMIAFGAGVAALCILAAVGTFSRIRAEHLMGAQRLEILRTLLERDLISADEFAAFEHRIMAKA